MANETVMELDWSKEIDDLFREETPRPTQPKSQEMEDRRLRTQDQWKHLDPDALYLWKSKEGNGTCRFCLDRFEYWTALSGAGPLSAIDRQYEDMICKGRWHPFVVSRPEHLVDLVEPVLLEGSGIAYELCHDLSKLIDDHASISETEDDPS